MNISSCSLVPLYRDGVDGDDVENTTGSFSINAIR
jgi:hypothetical protein